MRLVPSISDAEVNMESSSSLWRGAKRRGGEERELSEWFSRKQVRDEYLKECSFGSGVKRRTTPWRAVPVGTAFAISWLWQGNLPIHPYYNAEILIMRYYDKTRTISPY